MGTSGGGGGPCSAGRGEGDGGTAAFRHARVPIPGSCRCGWPRAGAGRAPGPLQPARGGEPAWLLALSAVLAAGPSSSQADALSCCCGAVVSALSGCCFTSSCVRRGRGLTSAYSPQVRPFSG